MPGGGTNRVENAVCSIPALLAMKGHAMNGRYKQKDSYDIYYCIRNYSTGIGALSDACRPLLEHPSGAKGYRFINEKFDTPDGYGPTCVKTLSRKPGYWETALWNSGNKTHLARSMNG